MSSSKDGVPRALMHNLKANHVMHERILLVTVNTTLTPRVDPACRISETHLGSGITRVIICYGFSETPDVPAALAQLDKPISPLAATYFLSRQTLVPSSRRGLRAANTKPTASTPSRPASATSCARVMPQNLMRVRSGALTA